MANSKLPLANSDPLITRVESLFTRVFQLHPQPHYHLLVAYSGGLDSTVLLHALVNLQKILCAKQEAAFQLQLTAMHVHHGLSPNADLWSNHCEQVCAEWDVAFELQRVAVDRQSAIGLEAAARNARYAALTSTTADFVCLAHHQNDQAETLLLQLARGAGLKGLSAMPPIDSVRKLLRPLLDIPHKKIQSYASRHGLRWIEDESNQNLAFDRNFMRRSVLPLLSRQYPGIEKTLSRTAQHMAEANALLADLASSDAEDALKLGTDGRSILAVRRLRALTGPRAKNLLRWWLDTEGMHMPSAHSLTQLLHQLLHARADASVCVSIGMGWTVRRYANHAYLVNIQQPVTPYQHAWRGEQTMQLGMQHRLVFKQVVGQGISLQKLGNTPLYIQSRAGGERFRSQLTRPSRTLQHILQAHGVPPWQRVYYPLVYAADKLICIPNVGVDANLAAQPGETGLEIRWELTPASS